MKPRMPSSVATAEESESDSSPFETLAELAGVALENPDAVGRLMNGVKAVADAVREIAAQKTEQERLRLSAQVEIERIRTVRDTMLSYLDRSFDERRKNFDALFSRLDAAIAQRDVDTMSRTLDTIVEIARSSPFKDLADAASAKTALKDKTREWVM